MAKNHSFKSIQIISDKAHDLWTRAKARIHAKTEEDQSNRTLPKVGRSSDLVVEISSWSVAKSTIAVLLVLLAAWALVTVRNVLIVVALSLFLSIVLDSSVSCLQSWGVPRSLAVMLMYFLFLALAIFLVASLIPIIALQLQDIARYVNHTADQFLAHPQISISVLSDGANAKLTLVVEKMLQSMQIRDRASALTQLNFSGASLIGFTVQVAGSVLNFLVVFILILFLTFFIQMEKEKIVDYVRIFVPREYRTYFDGKSDAIYHKMAQWVQGQIILCVTIGVLVFIALKILGMPYALTLAVLAGFTEFIPYAGPLIAAVPSVLIALSQFGFVWALVITGVYYIVQACENNLVVPLVMKHAVGLSPILVIVAMMAGISFPDVVHPVLGILLAVPLMTIVTIFLDDLHQASKRK